MIYFRIIHLTLVIIFLSVSLSWSQGEGHKYHEDAEYCRLNNLYDKAMDNYAKALEKEPKNPEYHFHKGLCLMSRNKIVEAIKNIENAVKYKSDYAEAYEILGNLYNQKRKYPQAIKYYDLAFKYDTDEGRKLSYKFTIITTLYLKNKYVSAQRHLEDAKKLAPDNFDILFLQARYFNVIGNYEKAKNNMEKITSQLPESNHIWFAKYYYELGLAYHHLGQHKKAYDLIQEKASTGSYRYKSFMISPSFYYKLADAYHKIHDNEDSEKAVEIALKMDPEHKGALKLKAIIESDLANLPRIQEMITRVKESIQNLEATETPDAHSLAKAYASLCKYEFHAHEYAYSMSSAEKSLKYEPNNLKVNFYRAISMYRIKKVEESLELLKSMSNQPGLDKDKKSTLIFAMGMIYMKTGDDKNAYTAFKSLSKTRFKYPAKSKIQDLMDKKNKSTALGN